MLERKGRNMAKECEECGADLELDIGYDGDYIVSKEICTNCDYECELSREHKDVVEKEYEESLDEESDEDISEYEEDEYVKSLIETLKDHGEDIDELKNMDIEELKELLSEYTDDSDMYPNGKDYDSINETGY